jgi:hypothetical protein
VLRSAAGISLPAARTSYLWFRRWNLFESFGTTFYDGGTVEVDDLDTGAGPIAAEGLPWVNGPTQTLEAAPARQAFGGDSSGYVASRVDLSSFAGKTVKLQFTTRTDSTIGLQGWYLDDIRVFTCRPV